MRSSHSVVIVIALILGFSGATKSAEGALKLPTNIEEDVVKSADEPLKALTATLKSPDESIKLSTESLKSPTDYLKSPANSLKLPAEVLYDYLKSPERVLKSPAGSEKSSSEETGCDACQPQSVTTSDTLTCHIISGIFLKDKLSVGSHAVTTIPQLACKVNITASAIENGHLVLTTSSGDEILNGRRRNTHSVTEYLKRATGTVFSYRVRPLLSSGVDGDDDNKKPLSSLQYILAHGPLDRSINLKVIKELVQGATEILYTYSIPKQNPSTVTYHRTRHHRNPRSTTPLNRVNSSTIRFQKKNHPRGATTSWKSVSNGTEETAKTEKTSAGKPRDDAQIQADQPFEEAGPEELGHGQERGYGKWVPNWNQYPARRQELVQDGRFSYPTVKGSYDSRRKLPELYGNPPMNPLYPLSYQVAPSHHQSLLHRRPGGFEQPEAPFSRPEMEVPFEKPEISLTQEDMGFVKPGVVIARPETDFSRPDMNSAKPEVNEEDHLDYDLQTDTEFRDRLSMPAYHGVGHKRTGFDSSAQQQLPAGYLQGQGQDYALRPAGPRSDLLDIPIYQRRESSDQGTVHHAKFYRNSFKPGIAGHSLVYGPRPSWPREPQSLLTHPEGFYSPPRSIGGAGASDTRYMFQPQPPPAPAPAPAQPAHEGFIRPELGQSQRLVAADEVARYDEVPRYVWKISGFTNCSRTCGGGTQSTMVVCIKTGSAPVRVTDENCEGSPKPTATNITCNNRPCRPSWEASAWGPCSTSCDLGQQLRQVECRQRISSAAVVTVMAARCQHEVRPEVKRDCNANRPCYIWKTKDWSQCSSVCGKGRRTREVTCEPPDGRAVDESKCGGNGINVRPKTVEDCHMEACSKSWYHSRWPKQCSSDCGDGVHSRRVHCGADDKKCNEKTKPQTRKECRSEMPCGGTWFVSSWTPCSVTCGEGVKRRDVVCMKKLETLTVIVNEDNCVQSERPSEELGCSEGPCPPLWFTTDWSECSRTCNTGIQLREAKCLDEKERASQSCDPLDKPELKQTCNINPCVSKPGRNNAQQLIVSCRDQMKTCQIVVQARLCRYDYYKEACCFSCSAHGYDEDTVSSQTTSLIQS